MPDLEDRRRVATNTIDLVTGNVTYQTSTIGNGGANATERPWSGALDEMRLSSVARTPDWLRASYLNQSAPDSFTNVAAVGQAAP